MTDFYIILAACPVLLLGATAFLVFAVVGIRRGDKTKRLTGKPRGTAEALARRMLTGGRGFDGRDESGDLPMPDTQTEALARHCNDICCRKCRARFRWMRRKAWRSRKSPNRRTRSRKR